MQKKFACIVGAQRSGSTYLYDILDQHPEIYMAKPVKPEPKYFINDELYAKGKNHYLSKYYSNIPTNTKVIGEKSTSYIEFEVVGKRIKRFFPSAKIFIILRDPVERSISNYYFTLENKLESRSITEVFIEKKTNPRNNYTTSVSPYSYIERSKYSQYLKVYKNLFADNLKVLILEELVKSKEQVRDLYNFLDVDSSFEADLSIKKNTSKIFFDDHKEIERVKYTLKKIFSSEILSLEKILNRELNIWK